jgi:hypothetical protein
MRISPNFWNLIESRVSAHKYILNCPELQLGDELRIGKASAKSANPALKAMIGIPTLSILPFSLMP